MDGDCAEYGNLRRFREPKEMSNKKFNSLDDQIDSGLGSLGYHSGSLDYLEESDRLSSVPEQQNQTAHNKNASYDNIVNSLRGLDIKTNVHSDSSSRCDSGLGQERLSSIPSLSQSQTSVLDSNSNRRDSGVIVDKSRVSGVQAEPSQNLPSQHLPLTSQQHYERWVPFASHSHFTSEQVMDIFRGDEDGDNHLHLSIIHGLPDVTLQVIGLAPDWEWLSQTNNLLQSPLHLAVITRQVHVVRRLMCAGARLDLQDQTGNTPLHNACRLGFEDVVRTLLTPVRYEETYQNNYDIPPQYIPGDLEAKNYDGLTCLHLAAIGGHLQVMRLLLQAGANVNAAEGKGGRTVLHLAADWGHGDMMKFLLERRDILIDAKTYAGLTPLVLAYGRDHKQTVAELYNKGASYTDLNLTEDSTGDDSDEEMSEDSVCSNLSSTRRSPRGHQFTNR